MEDAAELQQFLDGVMASKKLTPEEIDAQFLRLGRSMGAYFLGVLSAGVEVPIALHLTAAFQAALMPLHSSSDTP